MRMMLVSINRAHACESGGESNWAMAAWQMPSRAEHQVFGVYATYQEDHCDRKRSSF